MMIKTNLILGLLSVVSTSYMAPKIISSFTEKPIETEMVPLGESREKIITKTKTYANHPVSNTPNQIQKAAKIPDKVKKSSRRVTRRGVITHSQSAYASNSQRLRNNKAQKRERAIEQAKIQEENQAAYEAQARRNQVYYDTVIRPQQLKEAELRYQASKDNADRQQKQEMIQIQRDRNGIMLQDSWNRGNGPRRNRIIYGVKPVGIRLPY